MPCRDTVSAQTLRGLKAMLFKYLCQDETILGKFPFIFVKIPRGVRGAGPSQRRPIRKTLHPDYSP
jgi:hypothetical protein